MSLAQKNWKMERDVVAGEDPQAGVVAADSVIRSVVHLPTGLRFKCLVDAEGQVMSTDFESEEPRHPNMRDLAFEAMEFCQDYLDRARNPKVN